MTFRVMVEREKLKDLRVESKFLRRSWNLKGLLETIKTEIVKYKVWKKNLKILKISV